MVVFFIILVANIGGALTPLGDPPLFVGFLRGVDFFWTAQHLLAADRAARRARACHVRRASTSGSTARTGWSPLIGETHAAHEPARSPGSINFLLIAAIIAADPRSRRMWKPGIAFDVYGTTVELQNLLRDGALVLIAILSLVLTPNEHREANGFTWEPIREVAILFAGIFICIIPVLAMLAGRQERRLRAGCRRDRPRATAARTRSPISG